MAFTPEQLRIAQSIAGSQVQSRFPAGGNPYIATWVYNQTQKIAQEMFGNQQQAAPAPAPAPAAPPAPAAQDLKIAELTKEAQEYRSQAEKTISEAQAKISELSNEELQRQKATELQNRLAIQSQASAARGGMAPSLKIAAGAQTPKTAGTQAFRRRQDQFAMTPIQSTAGINVPTGSVLNI